VLCNNAIAFQHISSPLSALSATDVLPQSWQSPNSTSIFPLTPFDVYSETNARPNFPQPCAATDDSFQKAILPVHFNIQSPVYSTLMKNDGRSTDERQGEPITFTMQQNTYPASSELVEINKRSGGSSCVEMPVTTQSISSIRGGNGGTEEGCVYQPIRKRGRPRKNAELGDSARQGVDSAMKLRDGIVNGDVVLDQSTPVCLIIGCRK
jgi:hypothetical protein